MVDETGVLVGIVAADPLRLFGLTTILEEESGLLPVPVELHKGRSLRGLRALLLDASTVRDLPATLADLRAQWPQLPVMVLGSSTDPAHIQGVIASGAKGYLPGSAAEAEIRMAVRVVLDGSVWAPRKVLARLIEAGGVAAASERTPPRIMARLTEREAEVLHLLLSGNSNRQIATNLGIETVTVKAHLGRMFRKAAVNNRVELIAAALAERTPEDSQNGTTMDR